MHKIIEVKPTQIFRWRYYFATGTRTKKITGRKSWKGNIFYVEINLLGLHPPNGIFMYCITTLFISSRSLSSVTFDLKFIANCTYWLLLFKMKGYKMFIFQSWTCTLTVIENTVKEKKKNVLITTDFPIITNPRKGFRLIWAKQNF